jgi:hypothetical protein
MPTFAHERLALTASRNPAVCQCAHSQRRDRLGSPLATVHGSSPGSDVTASICANCESTCVERFDRSVSKRADTRPWNI